jgi:hypothetical protein
MCGVDFHTAPVHHGSRLHLLERSWKGRHSHTLQS